MPFAKVRPGVEEVFILVVQDQNGREKEKWTVLKRDFHKVVKILDNKYGLNVFRKREDRDLDWAR